MSEPMSAVEIEDVLSSIRRLVSEELRPLKRSDREATVSDEKLMLTPALRVVPDPFHANVEGSIPQDTGSLIGRLTDDLPSEVGFEAEIGDAAPTAVGMAQAWQNDADQAGMVVDVEDEPAEIETFVFHSRQSPKVAAGDAPSVPVALDGEILDPVQTDTGADAAGWAQNDVPDYGASSISELEATNEMPSPDGGDQVLAAHGWADPGAADLNGADQDWADQAEAEIMASLSPGPQSDQLKIEPQPVEPKSKTETDSLDDGWQFDEAVLRDLVRDLIREELQGSLGERITRNVRKLVRAEVARALALHDFE